MEWPRTFFGPGFYVGLIGLVGLVWPIYRRGDPAHSLLFVSSVVMLLATFLQNRFGYYLVPLLAVLTGAVCAVALNWGDRTRWFGFPVALILAGTVFYPSLRAGIQGAAAMRSCPETGS